jgi:arginine deiminase
MKEQLRLDTWFHQQKSAFVYWSKVLKNNGAAYLRKYRKNGKAVWRVRVQTFNRGYTGPAT